MKTYSSKMSLAIKFKERILLFRVQIHFAWSSQNMSFYYMYATILSKAYYYVLVVSHILLILLYSTCVIGALPSIYFVQSSHRVEIFAQPFCAFRSKFIRHKNKNMHIHTIHMCIYETKSMIVNKKGSFVQNWLTNLHPKNCHF